MYSVNIVVVWLYIYPLTCMYKYSVNIVVVWLYIHSPARNYSAISFLATTCIDIEAGLQLI